MRHVLVAGSALGTTTAGGFSYRGAEVSYADAEAAYLGTREEIYPTTVEQARDARATILDTMAEVIEGPDEMSGLAPKITSVKIPVNNS